MNLIAFGTFAIGVVLLILGFFLIAKRRKVTGLAVCLMGLGAMAAPFAITFFLLK